MKVIRTIQFVEPALLAHPFEPSFIHLGPDRRSGQVDGLPRDASVAAQEWGRARDLVATVWELLGKLVRCHKLPIATADNATVLLG